METIDALAVALGLATLAGLNLYLTVLVTGLAVRFDWVQLAEAHSGLAVLGDPWVIGVASVLYVLEFFADKVPWVDSLNDSVHTAVRPIGGALLGVLTLGTADPVASVIAALLCGGAAFTTHATKAGTRLVANASPEPVSNVALSLGEDAVVVGGLGLLAWNPLVAAALAVVVLVVAWVILPRLYRATRATAWLAWRKLNAPAPGAEPHAGRLPARCDTALRRAQSSPAPVVETGRCVSGGGPRLPANHLGWLVRLQSGETYFTAERLFGTLLVRIAPGAASRRSTFLSEALEISPVEGGAYRFHFERAASHVADRFAAPAALTPDAARSAGEPSPREEVAV